MATMSPLRRRMTEDMTVRNLSRSTQQPYIYAVAKFSRHFNRPPDRLGLEDVGAYQLHLIERKFSWSHINQVACGHPIRDRLTYHPHTLRHACGHRAGVSVEPSAATRRGRINRGVLI